MVINDKSALFWEIFKWISSTYSNLTTIVIYFYFNDRLSHLSLMCKTQKQCRNQDSSLCYISTFGNWLPVETDGDMILTLDIEFSTEDIYHKSLPIKLVFSWATTPLPQKISTTVGSIQYVSMPSQVMSNFINIFQISWQNGIMRNLILWQNSDKKVLYNHTSSAV